MSRVRFIGGSHAGETMMWDESKQGPVIRLADMTDCDFARPCDVDASIPQTVPVETYRIEKIRMGTGHEHTYGVLEPMQLVNALNVMWNGYQDSVRGN